MMIHELSADEAERLALRAQALERFAARYRHNPESQRAMLGALRRLARTLSEGRLDERTFPWELLVDEDLTEHVWSGVKDCYAPRTAAKDASALRQILDCCRRVGLLTYEEYQQARGFKAKAGPDRPPAGHYLAEADLGRIVQTCRTGRGEPATRIRDCALILTMATSGARGHEATGIDVAQLYLEERRIWLTRAKGGRQRNAFLHPVAVDAVEEWLTVRGPQPGPLFVPLSRIGRPMLEHGGLSTHQAWKIVRARGEEAGYLGITPHDLRRFVISALLEHVDVTLVAEVVGHRNPATTAGYDRRPQARQRDAVASLDLPALKRISDAGSGAAR